MYIESPGKRKYELKRRAESVQETRRRIMEATIDLHRTLGPAATQVTQIARRAGVQRVTVYNHFPDEGSLLVACSAHWRTLHPTPDPAAWLSIENRGERLRHGLHLLYGWYRETESMTANVLRDAPILPALGEIVERGLGAYLDRVQQALTAAFRIRGRSKRRLDAAGRVAVDFHTWRALASLGDADAAELAASLVELAAPANGRR